MMKICLYARADRLYYYVPLFKYFNDSQEFECFFVTESYDETEYVKKHCPSAHVYSLYEWLDKHKMTVANSELKSLQHKYSDVCIWRMLYSDRFLVNYNYEDTIKIVYNHFAFFEHVFEKENPGYLFNEAVATFGSYIAYTVSGKLNCKYVGTIIDRTHPYNRCFAFDNELQLSSNMGKSYIENNFTQDELIAAKHYYYEFINRDIKPAYMEKDKIPHFTWKCLFAPISYLNRQIMLHQKKYNNKYHYIEYRRPWNDRVYMDLERWMRFKLGKKYYQEPDYNESYYLFPLHFQPEATTLVCAEKYEKQIIAIDHIAKSLPLDSVLYVKEHYACLGHRQISFYTQLHKYPNVKLITPFANIHELIRKSKAVIVLTSTTGFEALIHKKKVFVLGNVFYQFSKNATKIRDIYDEWRELSNIECDKSDEEVIRFLCAYFSELMKGNILYQSEGFDSDENIKQLYNSYIAAMKKLI